MSRTKSSILNFTCAMIGQILVMIVSFVSRMFFVRILGNEYLGLNGLFTNILTILTLAELGVGPAITYSLYKPLAQNDTKKCKMLMQFFKKIYIIIGISILLIGISLTPFLHIFIKDIPNIPNINLIYILFLINTAISYFYSYKRNLIIADQNRYISAIYKYGFSVILNIAQIFYLIAYKNYIGFLVLQILATFLENYLISLKAEKMYPYLKEKDKIPLDEESKQSISKNTRAMIMHKIGGIVSTSIDNIVLSSYVGLAAVGFYSNYYLIINAVNSIISQIFNSLTSSIGNYCASSSKLKQYELFKKIDFLNFWIICFSTTCLLSLFNPFISLWVGHDFLFPLSVVIILVINFYISGMRKSILTFRDAVGLFYNDRYKAIFEAIINIFSSIILVKYFGVFGVFLGTFISYISTCIWIEPYVLFKNTFNKSAILYFKNYFKKLLLAILIVVITYLSCSIFDNSTLISFIIKCIICVAIPNIILFIIYRNTDEYKYFYDKLFNGILIKLAKKLTIRK